MGQTTAEMISQAGAARGLADCVEVRLDHLPNLSQLITEGDWAWLEQVREAAACPILGTIRTASQGGEADLEFFDYAEGMSEVAQHVEYVDVEWDPEMPPPILAGLIDAGRNGGARVLLSWHDFEQMPPMATIDGFFATAAEAGVEIAKIACQVENQLQAAQLLQVLARHYQQNQQPPSPALGALARPRPELLAIGMGPAGQVTRAVGHLFGNCATFAAVDGQASAPGQLGAQAMGDLLASMAGMGLKR
ncbi:hypothetical protein BK816_01300 [Boudabousia tangfeifanii]|uniref:3-dehydroquinate dehydratase n=2 Tax=Boudabousia tangfeifanii TaxID=1912795 RepID=A0A1D9MIS2_9ACTO|nr:hypothetical protein BK816_01300 [Boudabousia tangfeifanii]